MADVAVLALGLDTSQMKSGGDQASRTLDDIQRKFQELERRSDALKSHLQGAGTTIKATGQHWQEFGNQARNATQALSGIGGPVGSAVGRVQELGRSLTELVSTFGLVGAGALALGAALVSAGAAFVAFSIKGAQAADELLDVQEATGLSIDQVQRLGAAMQRSGESVKAVESSFRQFQQTVDTAIKDPTSEAAQNLRRLGVVATEAGRDTAKAYVETIAQLKALRSSTEGAVASNEVLGRNIGSLTRGASELQDILGKTRAELQATGIIASDLALGSAADLDKSMSRLNQSFETFKIQLNGLGGGVVNEAFEGLADILEKINGQMTKNEQHPFWKALIRGSVGAFGPASMISATSPTAARRDQSGVGPFGPVGPPGRPPIIPEPPRPPGAARAERAIQPSSTLADLNAANRAAREFAEGSRKVAEVFYATQLTDFQQYTVRMTEIEQGFREAQVSNARQVQSELEAQLSKLTPGTENFKRVNDELSKVKLEVLELADALGVVVLPEIGKFIERLKDFRQLTLPLGRAPGIDSRIPGVVDIGAAPSPGATRPRVFDEETFNRRAADRDRINQEFSFVFEDFIFQIASGRKKVGEAFGDFALGMVDVFASELARAFTNSLQKAFIAPLTNWLEGALSGLFEGILGGFSGSSGKGIGKFIGGALKSVFGGFFAEGGVLGAHKFGVVGERGPELIFAGAQPVNIQPMGAGGVMGVNITFNVSAPGGQLDRRSMDQMSEQVLRSVERANRNRGV